MPFIDHVLGGAALVARQATSAVATATTAPANAIPPSTTTLPNPSTTADAPSTTPTNSGNNNNNNSGGSSPLLFFVALGFGVVFTNLWIIVGVKYCFRYNARARQMRLAAEDGEPINMENMPHPRRRRREKKLMSIDEVNEKFPMMKYKTWVASRAKDGLPTRGGVDAPSRANSVRSAAGIIAAVAEPQQQQPPPKAADAPTASVTAAPPASADAGTSATASATATATASATPDSPTHQRNSSDVRASVVSADGDARDESVYNKGRTSDDHSRHSDDDDDEHIDSALPPECVGTSGDTCAICIDTLEDDDDVRGLTCGHAFHAVCLDPWLTSRRACCPLCKADYYTPKPRAAPVEGDAGQPGMISGVIPVVLDPSMSRNRVNIARPVASWPGLRGPGGLLQTRFMTRPPSSRDQQDDGSIDDRASVSQAGPAPPAASRSNWISNLRPFRRRQDQDRSSQEASQPAAAPAGPAAGADVTPSQLEAGVRN